MITSAVIIVLLLGVIAYAYRLMSLVNYDDGSNFVPPSSEFFDTVEDPENYTDLPTAEIEENEHTGEGRAENGIYNILLLGLDKDSGNLSDSIILVTIDTKTPALKMTSFMRDMLVEVPGHSNNKLNTPYSTGGIKLLKEVFAKNFDICVDGYAAVNFSTLVDVIDKLGGVSVYMTEAECRFLNTSNYIANPAYRNLEVYTGNHWLNGGQATGYARVRFVSKGNEADDFARTSRQRQILNAIYEQFRNQSLPELLSLMEKLLPSVDSDLDIMEMTTIATKGVTSGVLSCDLEQLRIPLDNSFQNSWYKEMLVLDVDFKTNVKELHRFIFGDGEEETEEETEPESSSGSKSESPKISVNVPQEKEE